MGRGGQIGGKGVMRILGETGPPTRGAEDKRTGSGVPCQEKDGGKDGNR